MSQTPFFSVVIPTYNRWPSLQRTLQGLARQRFSPADFEAVVISDGSTDDTDAQLERHRLSLPYRLRPFRQDNAGPARARNRGIQEAQGEVVVFLDDDVEPEESFLEGHALHHRKKDRLVVIGPQSRDRARRPKEPVWIAWEHAMLEKQYHCWHTGIWPSAGPRHFYTGNASLQRRYLVQVNGFNEEFKRLEDVELAHRLEREFAMEFLFEAKAAAVHRPTRSFDSWFNTAYAYGRLDTRMACQGDAAWEFVEQSYWTRNRITQVLARCILPRPALASGTYRSLLGGARAVYAQPGAPQSLVMGAMSTLYNLRYLEGVRDELGSWQNFRTTMRLT